MPHDARERHHHEGTWKAGCGDDLLAMIITALFLAAAEPSRAGERNPDPSDLYVNILLAVERARVEADSHDGDLKATLRMLNAAVVSLNAIRKTCPDWNPGMVDYRIRTTRSEIERLKLSRSNTLRGNDSGGKAAAGLSATPGIRATPSGEARLSLRPPLGRDGNGRPMGIRVLILSDSMGIGGFGERLDARFRALPGVEEVYTYMACGTNPLTWMKAPPYANATTRCGFISIESVPGQLEPEVFRDVYGIPKGHKPGRHRVPKIENLVARIQPHLVVFQNGNNFFSGFKDRTTINPPFHGPMIRAHVAPLVRWLAENGSSVRRFYWVSPPEAGIVTPEIQQFVFEAIEGEMKGIGTMLDSREVTTYPYKAQAPDKEHFWGNESIAWGEATFAAIERELDGQNLLETPALSRRGAEIASERPVDVSAGSVVRIRARLLAKSPVPSPASIAPYGEFLIGYTYKVDSVASGSFPGERILILHPAFIGHRPVDLSGFRVGENYELEIAPLSEASPWATVGSSDAVGAAEMVPYMLIRDVFRHPDAQPEADAPTCCR